MINDLLNEIDSSLTKFIDGLPDIQKRIYEKLLLLLKDLDLYSDGSIKNNLVNIQKIGKLKSELEKIILDKPYLKSVGTLLGSYEIIQEIQNEYFSTITTDFTPKKVFDVVKDQAIDQTAEGLTESGINANVIDPIKAILKTNITSGGSYADLAQQLRDEIMGNDEIDGKLLSYARTYATTAVNEYSAQYTKIVTDDLGMEWFRYVGSLRKTSRPFCIALVEKDYVHVSEIPEIVKGHIDGKDVSLAGLKDGTDANNFQVYRGGWNCNHQLSPVDKSRVPEKYIKNITGD